jgi:hypothetical protein
MAGPSRYDGAPTGTVVVEDGTGGVREVTYLLTRLPLDPVANAPLAWHRVLPDDRLDLLASRYLGDPAAAWRIADVNLALDPDDLVGPGTEGHVVVIPVPGV